MLQGLRRLTPSIYFSSGTRIRYLLVLSPHLLQVLTATATDAVHDEGASAASVQSRHAHLKEERSVAQNQIREQTTLFPVPPIFRAHPDAYVRSGK